MRLPYQPTHPGELLLEEFLNPLGISQVDFARHIGVSFKRVNEIVNGRRGVTPETAVLFSQAFGNTPQFWLNAQNTWDLARCQRLARKPSVPRLRVHDCEAALA